MNNPFDEFPEKNEVGWLDEDKIDAWREKWEHEILLWREHSGRWRYFLMHGEYTPQQVSEWREKSERWNQIEPMIPEITRIILDAHKVAKLLRLVTKPRSDEE